jgi:hypothetical protein
MIGVTVLGFVGAGAAVTWSVMSRPQDAFITHEVADSFNLQEGPAPARSPMALAPGETLRDAVAAAPPVASSLVRPTGTDSLMYSSKAPAAQPDYKSKPVTAKAETWARKSKLVAALVTPPAAFLMNHSSLSSARGLRAFLADPKKVDGYMNSALVRIAINSPTVAKALLGNPAVIRAFLSTPAMKDPAAVRALVGSPMVQKMLDCPAIQEAMTDPGVMNKMMADPQTLMWVVAHPDALEAISKAAPALGDAITSKAR